MTKRDFLAVEDWSPLEVEAVLLWRITQSLKTYHAACNPGGEAGRE